MDACLTALELSGSGLCMIQGSNWCGLEEPREASLAKESAISLFMMP